MIDTWFAPKDILYTSEQIIWLLENLPMIREGRWPPRPTNYVDPKVQHSYSSHAYFEIPILIIAELLIRLDNTYEDGVMAELQYVYGEVLESIAKRHHLDYDTCRNRINRAINYCCGLKRKGDYRQKW